MDGKKGGRNFNGWANCETWLIKFWLDEEGPDDPSSNCGYWVDDARFTQEEEGAVRILAERIRDTFYQYSPSAEPEVYEEMRVSDLSGVDWLGIALHYFDLIEPVTENGGSLEGGEEGQVPSVEHQPSENLKSGQEQGFGKSDWVEIAANRPGAVAGYWPSEVDSCDGRPMPSMNPENSPRGNEPNPGEDPFGDLIFSYSRAQAVEDGVLVDVTEAAREAGFRYPVALTRTIFERYVAVPEGVRAQDERGRLWDVVYMCSLAVKGSGGGSEIPFSLHVRNSNRRGTPPLVTLKARCGPGDRGEPVITIMLPGED